VCVVFEFCLYACVLCFTVGFIGSKMLCMLWRINQMPSSRFGARARQGNVSNVGKVGNVGKVALGNSRSVSVVYGWCQLDSVVYGRLRSVAVGGNGRQGALF